METGETYIQKNPLFGRKVMRFDRVRPSVWDWDICDVTIVTIDKDPSIVHVKGAASSIYDHQGLCPIPDAIFSKILNMAKLLEVTINLADEQRQTVLRQETLGKIIELLEANGIIDDSTYDSEHLRMFAADYDHYSRQQMARVTDVIDVHK